MSGRGGRPKRRGRGYRNKEAADAAAAAAVSVRRASQISGNSSQVCVGCVAVLGGCTGDSCIPFPRPMFKCWLFLFPLSLPLMAPSRAHLLQMKLRSLLLLLLPKGPPTLLLQLRCLSHALLMRHKGGSRAQVRPGDSAHPGVTRTQLSLIAASAITVHKSQEISLAGLVLRAVARPPRRPLEV